MWVFFFRWGAGQQKTENGEQIGKTVMAIEKKGHGL